MDREYTNPNMKKKVDLLVAEEMSRSDKTIEEYLAEISVPEQTSILKNTIFMETEMKRLADKETAPGFDDSRYKVQVSAPCVIWVHSYANIYDAMTPLRSYTLTPSIVLLHYCTTELPHYYPSTRLPHTLIML